MSLFNKLVVLTLPIVPKGLVKMVAQRYIAGPFLKDAIRTTQGLMEIGASSTIDVLGEFVESESRAQQEFLTSLSVIEGISAHSLHSTLSVKLTSLGLNFDAEFAYKNIAALVQRARELGVFVRMDMENTPYTDATLEFYRRLRADGFTNIGLVIQAYLRRSEADIRSLLEYSPSIRLCKGIYVEPESLAFHDVEEIRTSYRKLLRLLLDGGADVRIATHDEALIEDAKEAAAERGIAPSAVEFQMLLGVREQKRHELITEGYGMRVYVPFGEDWYGYSTRRLKENPEIAGHVAKAFLHLTK